MSHKLKAGEKFPQIIVKDLSENKIKIGNPKKGCDWQMVIIYRGRHCPLCTKYLNELEKYKERLFDNKVDLIAVSADRKEQLESHVEKLNVSFPLYYGLTLEQMENLGLYISIPRSEKETDHNFSEPGLFVINEKGNIHVTDLSNNPFVRPEIESLVSGLEWIRDPENNYPIRGTY